MAKVVQIDAVKLDSYLKDIKSQLQKHDDELLNPVWLTSIKPEIDKVNNSKLCIEQLINNFIFRFLS